MIIKAPKKFIDYLNKPSVFLSGSIEMGEAEDWQARIEKELNKLDILILNPRRDDWDISWKQDINNIQFKEQVEWELKAQEKSNIIALNFVVGTKSPITLLELGLFAGTGKLIVHCPEGFWRKGNVDIVCRRYKIKQVNNIKEFIEEIRVSLQEMEIELQDTEKDTEGDEIY